MDNTISSIGKPEIQVIRQKALEALQAAFSGSNLEVRAIKSLYTSRSVEIGFEFAIRGADGVAETLEVQAFRRSAFMFGLKPEDLGKEFRSTGKVFRLTGMKPGSSKYPFLAMEVKTGRQYKFTGDDIKRLLAS